MVSYILFVVVTIYRDITPRQFFNKVRNSTRIKWMDNLSNKDYVELCTRGFLTTRIYCVSDAESAFEHLDPWETVLPFYRSGVERRAIDDWKDGYAENISLLHYAEIVNKFKTKAFELKPDKLPKGPIEIITAHIPVLGKTLVIDGCHRLVALYNYEHRDEIIKNHKIVLYEISGDMAISLFPCDLVHLVISKIE